MIKNKKGSALIIIVLIVTALITFCGLLVLDDIKVREDFGTEEGIVIEKKYTEAHISIFCTYVGRVMIPHRINYPEKYQLHISKNINGEKKTLWVTVSKEIYNNLEIEDYYKKGE